MTSIHETITTQGKIMMNIGEIDIGGLGLHNKPWLCHPIGVTKYIRMMQHNAHTLVLAFLFW